MKVSFRMKKLSLLDVQTRDSKVLVDRVKLLCCNCLAAYEVRGGIFHSRQFIDEEDRRWW